MPTIRESGMEFGPFNDNQLFHIENSTLYHEIGQGVRSVEFLLMANPHSLLFVEAKSGSPNPAGPMPENFDAFIQEVSEKFVHSFDLFYSTMLKRHEQINDIPDSFKQIDSGTVKIKFCLVIKDHAVEWLPPICEALKRKMAPHAAIWNSQITVLNDHLAKEYRLICA